MADMTLTMQEQPAHIPAWRQAAISCYWFGSSVHWTAILTTLLPLQAERIGGSEFKGSTLGYILGLGAVVSMAVAPIFGAWSDRIRSRWGRRKPFLVAGTIGNVLGLLLLAFIPSVPSALLPYVGAYLIVNLFNNLATAPYSALIPEQIPEAQRGAASGWMGLLQMLGNFLGAVVGLVLGTLGQRFGEQGAISIAYLAVAAILVLGMVATLFSFSERDTRDDRVNDTERFNWATFWRGIREPFRSRDFTWVFWTRFLVTLGTFTLQGFVLFYMLDVVAGGNRDYTYTLFGMAIPGGAAGASSIFFLMLLFGAIISSLTAGWLSDRFGRKLMVYISGALQGIVVLAFILSSSFEVSALMGIVFGLGYGAYNAVDWAMGADVLPSKDDYAKDMGVWHIAMTLPQSIATPIAGILLDTFQRIGRGVGLPTLGYTVIFAMAFVYFMLGTVLVRQVRGVR